MYKEEQLTNIKEIILNRIAQGESVNEITKDENLISQKQFYILLNKDKEFLQNYTRARDQQAIFYAEKIQGELDKLSDKPTREQIDKTRLIIDSYKWIASRLAAKTYSNQAKNQTNIQIVQPITGMQIIDLPEEDQETDQ